MEAQTTIEIKGTARTADDKTDHDDAETSRFSCMIDHVLVWAGRKLQTNGGFALLFLIAFGVVWLPILATALAAGKSFFWQVDGLYQQYVWFVYTGQWIREFASNIFVSHTFIVPQWTMDSGFGTSIIQAFASTFVNPFYWISAIVPERFAEYAAEAMMLLNIYLAGLAFSAWCIHNGAQRSYTFIGALAYVFAGNVVIMFTQPSFLIDLLTFPLILLGADKVFEHKSPALFLVVLGWSFLSSFYDTYMICIMLVLYCLYKFFAVVDKGRESKGRIKRLIGWIGTFVSLVIIAMLIGCVLMLPQVMSLAGDSRMGVERTDSMFYSLSIYVNFLTGFITYADMTSDAYTGFNVLAPIVLVLLAMRWRDHKGLFFGFVILTVMMLLPFFGRIMNGFQYPADRWSWAYSLWVAFIIVKMLPEVLAMSKHERHVVTGWIVAYGVVVLVLPFVGRTLTFSVAYTVLIAMLALILSARHWQGRHAQLMASIVCLVALSGAVTFVCYLSPYFGNYATWLMGVGKNWTYHSSGSTDNIIQKLESEGGTYDETYRYDRTSVTGSFIHNSNLVTGHMSPDYYNSIYSQYIDDFLTSLGLVDTEGLNFRYGSLNQRAMLQALLGVKYFSIYQTNISLLPAAFRDSEPIAQGQGVRDQLMLYETEDVAPLAFVSSNYITNEEYEALPLADRQNALLQATVLDETDVAQDMTDVSDQLELTSVDVPYEIEVGPGIEVNDGSFKVRTAGATITLTFQSPENAETYLQVNGLYYQDISYRERYTDVEWEQLGFINRIKTMICDPQRTVCTNGPIQVRNEQGIVAGVIYTLNEQDHLYGNKHDWLCNVGYSEDGLTTMTLYFVQPGIYSFDNISVIAQPMDTLSQQAQALSDAGASDITIGTNVISCSATAQKPSQLFLSVAYSDGWTATVDGEPATIHRADLGFMSVDLPAGTHTVVLQYQTPYLREGAVLSCIGIGVAIVICVVWRVKRKHGQ